MHGRDEKCEPHFRRKIWWKEASWKSGRARQMMLRYYGRHWGYTLEGEGADWVHLAEDKIQWWDLVNRVIKLWVPAPLKARNLLTGWATISFWRRSAPWSYELISYNVEDEINLRKLNTDDTNFILHSTNVCISTDSISDEVRSGLVIISSKELRTELTKLALLLHGLLVLQML
jgi:hypothetical protein